MDGVKSNYFGRGMVGIVQGVWIGGPSSLAPGTLMKHMQFGVTKELVNGLPLVPSIKLLYPGSWRFRWVVATGDRSISVWTLQAINLAPRPALIVKANAAVGLASDIISPAGAGSGWVQIPAATFTATAAGVVWVELHNRLMDDIYPAYFDYVTTT